MSKFYKQFARKCRGDDHLIIIRETDDGRVLYELNNHTPVEVEEEAALGAMGSKVCECVADYIAMRDICDALYAVAKDNPKLYQQLEAAALKGAARVMS